MMEKARLDVLLVERGLTESREKARALIMAGEVLVDGKAMLKAGENVPRGCELQIRGNACPFVSRGGLKLQKAIDEFGIDLAGRICADIGASTGGFTDCMLQHGAQKVYAVDVGYGQLDWKLRNHPRVVSMERTNARYLEAASFDTPPSFASVDVSFISLRLIFPALRAAGVGEVVSLIKPQFEAGKEKVGKKGVVRDPHVHEEVIGQVLAAACAFGFVPLDLTYSPIKGPNGNIEYLAHYRAGAAARPLPVLSTLVAQAFAELK